MHAGDAARVARGRQPDERETLFTAQLGQEDAVGFHAQAGFEQRLGGDPGRALSVLAVEQVDHIGVVGQGQFGGVLDGDQALVFWHFFDQPFHEGGLARSGFAADHDGAVVAHSQTHEVGVSASGFQGQQLALKGLQAIVVLRVRCGGFFTHAAEQAVLLEVTQPEHHIRRLADGDGHGAARHSGRYGELDALAGGQRGRQQRAFLIDLLVAVGGQRSGQGQATLLCHGRCVDRLPAMDRFHLQLAGAVHTDLHHAWSVQLFTQRAQELNHRGGVAAPAVERVFFNAGQGVHRFHLSRGWSS
ncbi:hypothetical protein Y695_02942 [Hydrogenophaga sp. T4]|nr:hypothetical protein Y695_02942 [Hydrogenophaga sp. T4]